MVRAWDFFTEWVKGYRGGIILNGSSYSIAFDFIEDYSNKTLVTEVYTSLLPGFNLFFGPYSSVLSRSAADVTDPAGRFLLAAGTNTSAFKDRKSAFTTLPPNMAYFENSFAALVAYGAKTTAVIKDSDFAGCGTPQESHASAIKAGITLYKHYDVDSSSPYYYSIISSIIAELKEHGVETVMGCTYSRLCFAVCNMYVHEDIFV
jgi:ABC-type branched-subunit amino acid transport system substrate-binding protein